MLPKRAIFGEFSMSFSGGSTTRHLAPAHFAPKYLRKGRLCHYYLVPVPMFPLFVSLASWCGPRPEQAAKVNEKPSTLGIYFYISTRFLYLFLRGTARVYFYVRYLRTGNEPNGTKRVKRRQNRKQSANRAAAARLFGTSIHSQLNASESQWAWLVNIACCQWLPPATCCCCGATSRAAATRPP